MAIKGAVLGDILGSQYEFNRLKNFSALYYPPSGISGIF